MSKIKNDGLDQYGPERFGRLILLYSQKNAGLKGLKMLSVFLSKRPPWTLVLGPLLFRPPDIVCRRTYILPVFLLLLSFFFFAA